MDYSGHLIQALTTVGVGLGVLVLGQIFLKLVLDPLVELRRTLADVNFYRRKWANRYMTKESAVRVDVGEDNWKDMRLAQEELRMICVKVGRDRATAWPQSLLRLYEMMALIPSAKDLDAVQSSLMLLSNSVFNANYEFIAKADEQITSILG